MNSSTIPGHPAQQTWLTRYYFVRAGVSIAWVAAVLTLAPRSTGAAALLLVCYPLWDALANYIDGKRSGGLAANRTQLLNVIVSLVVALALVVALPNIHQAFGVFGAWAVLSGLLQLGTGLRRWKAYGAQWAMILSGAQSALAGATFIYQAQATVAPSIVSLAGYAGFGAFYFLVSALLLTFSARRHAGA